MTTAIRQFKEATKMLYGYLTVLGITSAVRSVAEAHISSGGDTPHPTSPHLWFGFLVSVSFILRFFFGNIRHLASDKDNNIFEIIADTITILAQALLLAYSTFFFQRTRTFVLLIISVLAVELLWYISVTAYGRLTKKPSDMDGRIVTSNLAAFITAICLVFLLSKPSSTNNELIKDIWLWIVFSINTIADIVINGPRYLGLKWFIGAEDSPHT